MSEYNTTRAYLALEIASPPKHTPRARDSITFALVSHKLRLIASDANCEGELLLPRRIIALSLSRGGGGKISNARAQDDGRTRESIAAATTMLLRERLPAARIRLFIFHREHEV